MHIRIMCSEHISPSESITFSVDSRETFETLVDLERLAYSNALVYGGMHFSVELPTKDGGFFEVTNGFRPVHYITYRDVSTPDVVRILSGHASLQEAQAAYNYIMGRKAVVLQAA